MLSDFFFKFLFFALLNAFDRERRTVVKRNFRRDVLRNVLHHRRENALPHEKHARSVLKNIVFRLASRGNDLVNARFPPHIRDFRPFFKRSRRVAAHKSLVNVRKRRQRPLVENEILRADRQHRLFRRDRDGALDGHPAVFVGDKRIRVKILTCAREHVYIKPDRTRDVGVANKLRHFSAVNADGVRVLQPDVFDLRPAMIFPPLGSRQHLGNDRVCRENSRCDSEVPVALAERAVLPAVYI